LVALKPIYPPLKGKADVLGKVPPELAFVPSNPPVKISPTAGKTPATAAPTVIESKYWFVEIYCE
jgi:hypothetical protein